MSIKIIFEDAIHSLPMILNFEQLKLEVTTFFNIKSPNVYKLYYRDIDDDLIVITNQGDYELALSQGSSELIFYLTGTAESARELVNSKAPKFAPVQSCYVPIEPDIYACLECDGKRTNQKGTKPCKVCAGTGRVPEEFLESIRNLIRAELPAVVDGQFLVAASQLLVASTNQLKEVITAKVAPQPTMHKTDKKLDLRALVIKDIPANSFQLEPGEEFRKVWTLKNTGADSWPADTALKNVNGYNLQAAINPVGELRPGRTIDVLISGKTPHKVGRYVSYYQLTHGNNESFGDKLWIDITVINYEHEYFDFK